MLLKTKLNMPVLRDSLIQRQRLVDQLNFDLWTEEGFARKLTLISAPAGYGKTTAAVEWLSEYPGRKLWLSLDEDDNDPARFIAYLVAAFQEVDANIGSRTMQMAQSPEPPAVETLITALINDIAGIQSSLILALDDYHFIQTPKIHEMVGYFLEHQPNHLHQVVLTREDPLLPVSRLLSRGQALEIRQEDLRFTSAESSEFLGQTMGVKLPRNEMEALQRRTEGWVAGLQFAALSLQGHPDQDKYVQQFTGSNRYILDYLFEEVFNRQPAAVQEFLVRTSILNQLTAELCDAVVEREESQEVLMTIERGNLFIVPLDLSREWYRYHRLFRDLLRHQLQIHEQSLEASLHLRASEWYEAHGMQAEAVQHALLAKEWIRAGELVLGVSNRMIKQGEIVTLLGWFKQFPEQVMRRNPQLSLEFAWALILTGQNEAAEAMLAHVESITREMPEHRGTLVSAQAFVARTKGDIPATIELSEKALTLIPQDDRSTRGILAINLGITYWHVGQMEQAEKSLQEAQTLSQESGNIYALLSAMVFLGRVQAVRGNLRQAVRAFEQAIEKGGEAPIIALAHLDLAVIHYEWNDLRSCREQLEKGQEINETSGNLEFLSAGYMLETRLENASGNQKAYAAALSKVQELVQSGVIPAPNHNRCLAFLVEMALMEGEVLAAEQLVEQLEMDVDAHAFYRYIGLAKERLLIAQNEKSTAAKRLQEKIKKADQADWVYGGIATRILQSIVAEGQETEFEIFTEALARSQTEGYLRVYADHGQVMVPNLLEAARRGLHTEYIGRILACIRQDEALETAAASQVEKLSERELEVLRLIAVGLSNREIAEQLYLSPGTIKTHVHNICGKLEASNRTQAVMHARDFNLI
jgi:LuxR family maltose regulon positive regulatory protein